METFKIFSMNKIPSNFLLKFAENLRKIKKDQKIHGIFKAKLEEIHKDFFQEINET